MKHIQCSIEEEISTSCRYTDLSVNSFNESELQRADAILKQIEHLASPAKEREFVRLVMLQSLNIS